MQGVSRENVRDGWLSSEQLHNEVDRLMYDPEQP
jgi:hypothetical protein